ncbi:hypothetical protein RclHR1_01590018 [Rhizophagus clarus]|uniref:Protein vts1 n=1 Tax=Rhizophagus clarus TaxID=94130 RepID=A0A2Z6QGA3_9GLOM|nr:hypothetical protein RclHR1_01590018 [Rhizophagus clarus]GES87202.1 protein vts1 [Rhizophagus clarus]
MTCISHTLVLKSLLSNNTNKLITLTSPLSRFIRINISSSYIQFSESLSYTTKSTKISNNNNDNTHGHILYYLKEDKMSLKDFNLNNIDKIRKNNLKKKIYQTNKKRLFIRQNIIQTNFDALEDFTEWLRNLRFKKWAPIFEGMKWQDIIQLKDEQLLEKGIKSYTIRSELLYYFNIIKAAKAERDAKKEIPGISETKDDKDKD